MVFRTPELQQIELRVILKPRPKRQIWSGVCKKLSKSQYWMPQRCVGKADMTWRRTRIWLWLEWIGLHRINLKAEVQLILQNLENDYRTWPFILGMLRLEQEFEPIRQPRLFQVQGKFFQTWIVLQDLASQNLRWWEILWSLWILPYCSSWCIMLVYRRCINYKYASPSTSIGQPKSRFQRDDAEPSLYSITDQTRDFSARCE